MKTVTRRHVDTWQNLRANDPLTLIEKGMGLPKGAKQIVITQVTVVSNRPETLRQVTPAEVIAEGLWDRALDESTTYADYYDPDELPVLWFRAFWAAGHLGGTIDDWAIGRHSASLLGVECRRIEWLYPRDLHPFVPKAGASWSWCARCDRRRYHPAHQDEVA